MNGNPDTATKKPYIRWTITACKPHLLWISFILLLLGILIQVIGRPLFGPSEFLGKISWNFFIWTLFCFVFWTINHLTDHAKPSHKPANENHTPLLQSLGLVLTGFLVKVVGRHFFGSSEVPNIIFGYLLLIACCLFIYWFITHFMVSFDSTPTKKLNNMVLFKTALVMFVISVLLVHIQKYVSDPSLMPVDIVGIVQNTFVILFGTWFISNFLDYPTKSGCNGHKAK